MDVTEHEIGNTFRIILDSSIVVHSNILLRSIILEFDEHRSFEKNNNLEFASMIRCINESSLRYDGLAHDIFLRIKSDFL